MQKGSNTKEKILEIAEKLIMSKGYNCFCYKDISSKLNIKNASIHYHFPVKKDLGIAVIQIAQARFKEWDKMVATKKISPVDMLQLILETFIGYLESEEYICLGGSLETDFHTLPGEMQKEVRNYAADILAWLRNLLSIGREERFFTFTGPSEMKAFFLLSCATKAIVLFIFKSLNI